VQRYKRGEWLTTTEWLPEIAIAQENGASAKGWTSTEVTDVGSAGTVHGPWGNGVIDVDIGIPAGVTQYEVSWCS
jgi:hypothetical protein